MEKIKTQAEKVSGRFGGMLCVAALAAFALFAACERPEPEPEPPTPPVVDTDTLPTNKFVGTWVLCAMNNVNDEPPATCDLADATTDTLVFVDDTTLIRFRGTNSWEHLYDFSDHFLVCYWPGNLNSIAFSVRYYFRNDDQELILRGGFMGIKNFCFHRIS
ncbi:MAG: hypothetical protein IKZ54_06750 [Bacteroidales bacterium]|nr:hypothetical protein [Bacteroidales bacterium]